MPSFLAALLLWGAVAAAVTGQVMILRSSRRILRRSDGHSQALEWAFAVGPALVLALVLVLTWRSATRPPVVHIEVVPGMISGGGDLRS